jgi:catechol 2,3-dioxygenase-like lactoylglutathione lyase family enzyme
MGAATDVRLDRISMFILYVRDPMRSVPFFRDLLGMKVLEATPQWAQLDGGGVHLALHPHASIPAKRDAAHPWVVFEVEDLRGAYESLRRKGLAFRGPPVEVCGDEQRAGMSADFEDLDGNLFSLFGYVPRESPGTPPVAK